MKGLISWVVLGAIVAGVSGCDEKNSEQIEEPYGKWARFHEKDPITDADRVSAVLNSEPVSDGLAVPAELHVRCSDGNLEVYISWNRYIGRVHDIDSRIDDMQHEPNRWAASSDGKSSFYPFVGPTYLDRLNSSARYVARVETFTGSSITAAFNTSSFSSEAGPVIASCGK